ncbi:hypothetical protein PCANC_16488 [Puccinia coronata f. sp. avenae]|uniref:Uncharacterized protein n=1 Tax=Puccinia coronata f. sp. avenae TaxID=200324 RepID=A0A2N5SRR9_9BASI|nr:hypothetical protein PCANC_16488 [Puccinia coronata f. sp. avenae]
MQAHTKDSTDLSVDGGVDDLEYVASFDDLDALDNSDDLDDEENLDNLDESEESDSSKSKMSDEASQSKNKECKGVEPQEASQAPIGKDETPLKELSQPGEAPKTGLTLRL